MPSCVERSPSHHLVLWGAGLTAEACADFRLLCTYVPVTIVRMHGALNTTRLAMAPESCIVAIRTFRRLASVAPWFKVFGVAI
jgi:hypothetical protein